MEEIFRFTRTFILVLVLGAAASFTLPAENAQAGRNGKDCPKSVHDVGMPEIEPQYSIPEEYDKDNLFTNTVESFKSGEALFRIDGFVLEATKINEPEDKQTFSSDEELVGLEDGVRIYEPDSLDKGDLLKAIPSISTEDDKTLGILVPPFAYFSKKF